MPEYKIQSVIDGQPTFSVPLTEILSTCKVGGALKTLSPNEYITDQQRKWWKGVLLKHLSEDTGESVHWWETRLKIAVIPDKFQPEMIAYGKQVLPFVPSITILSKNQMNEIIEGAISHLHDGKIYGDQFLSYTLPDRTLRKDWNWKDSERTRALEADALQTRRPKQYVHPPQNIQQANQPDNRTGT